VSPAGAGPRVGVLALQGAVEPHRRRLEAVGASVVEVRRPEHLAGIDAIVVPGGESTTMSRLLGIQGLTEPLAEALAGGLPALGTCAGMILLAREVLDGRDDQRSFGVIDLSVRRNAFGGQVESFEVDLPVAGVAGTGAGYGAAFHAVFIRAPFVERVGGDVEVLAEVDGHPVAARQGPVVVTAFHPELAVDGAGADDLRLHRWFVGII
jgi:5'-phosphate synthase pdxT subunit